jgi:hypothetical protein
MVIKNIYMEHKNVTKAPHYFLVHFIERFTCINGANPKGKAYTITCDNVPVHVYGFNSEEESKIFDPLTLRGLLIGGRERKILWSAPNEEILIEEINNHPFVKEGVYTLSKDHLHGAIENLPECSRMHIDSDEMLLCGNPENEFNDGCYGGCVLQQFDQDEDMPGGFKCPMHVYWNELFEKRKMAKAS